MLTACISIYSDDWTTPDGQYSCRSDSTGKNTEGKLTCYVCDRNITQEPDKFRQAVIYCKYTSAIQKQTTLLKFDMPTNIIKIGDSNTTNDARYRGTEKIGVDKVEFIKAASNSSGLDTWLITLHRICESGDSFGSDNTYFYSYIFINQLNQSYTLDSCLSLNKYINAAPYIDSETPVWPEHKKDIYKSTILNPPLLLDSVTNNDLSAVNMFLTYYPGINPNFSKDQYPYGGNALTTAAWNGNNDITKTLLNFPNINIYFTDTADNTALKNAISHANIINTLDVINTLKARYAQNLLDACKRLVPGTTGYDAAKVDAAVTEVNTIFTQCSDVDVTAKDSTGHNAFYYAKQIPDSNQNKQAIVGLFTSRGAQAV